MVGLRQCTCTRESFLHVCWSCDLYTCRSPKLCVNFKDTWTESYLLQKKRNPLHLFFFFLSSATCTSWRIGRVCIHHPRHNPLMMLLRARDAALTLVADQWLLSVDDKLVWNSLGLMFVFRNWNAGPRVHHCHVQTTWPPSPQAGIHQHPQGMQNLFSHSRQAAWYVHDEESHQCVASTKPSYQGLYILWVITCTMSCSKCPGFVLLRDCVRHFWWIQARSISLGCVTWHYVSLIIWLPSGEDHYSSLLLASTMTVEISSYNRIDWKKRQHTTLDRTPQAESIYDEKEGI